MLEGSCNVKEDAKNLRKQCFLKVGDVAVSMLSLDLTLFFLYTVALTAITLSIPQQKESIQKRIVFFLPSLLLTMCTQRLYTFLVLLISVSVLMILSNMTIVLV